MKNDDNWIKGKIRDYSVEAKEKDFEEELSTAESVGEVLIICRKAARFGNLKVNHQQKKGSC